MRSHARWVLLSLSGMWVLAAPTVDAEPFRAQATFGISETLTNNVSLAPSGSAQSDLVTQLTPGIVFSETSAHTAFQGTVSVPVVLYARTSGNNQAYVQANVTGTVEAIENFFFIDGSVDVSQQYLTPFGALPPGLSNATGNRYTSGTYRLSPFIKGGRGNLNYEVRNDNVWTSLSGAPFSLDGAYYNSLAAKVTRDPTPFGWKVEYNRTEVKFNEQQPLRTQLGRATLTHQPDPQLQLTVDAGYEDNDYTFTQSRGVIYGVGGTWRPTNRTNLSGFWEHRFFGSSYLLNFDHRMPRTVFTINASRNITSYPQQLGALPSGFDIGFLVNQLFLSTIPDPVQRQLAVDQFIRNRGLPLGTLANPVTLYTQQISLQEQASASIGLLGVRNTIFFTAYYLHQQPITAAGNDLPPLLSAANNIAQEGVSAVWTHAVTPSVSFVLNGSFSRSLPNKVPETEVGNVGTTRQGYVIATLATSLSPTTQISGGVRYQLQRSDVAPGYTEAAAFVTLSHTFR
ncbi:MAG: TIGR03016 family PEP-CTERM system-associated outer membrane protein [Casimicrobiaceae bacterium]